MDYLDCLEPERARQAASWVAKKIKPLKPTHVLVTGLSGIIVGALVARTLKINLCVVRKGRDYSHGSRVEYRGDLAGGRLVMVDDFIHSGTTVRRVFKNFRKYIVAGGETDPRIIAICCYAQYYPTSKNFYWEGEKVPIIYKGYRG